MSLRKKILIPVLLLISLFLGGWGGTGHKIINKNSVLFFPPQMKAFLVWADTLSSHASDADYRKVWDFSETPKHFIDIDDYPEFVSHARISHDYDSLVATHGSFFVISTGTLPWAIIAAYGSLRKYFERRDWHNAGLVASDLGHYVADSHQPLHITTNYNPGGLHSRYETTMINTYQSQIVYQGDSIHFIGNIPDFVFSTIYYNYQFVDSVINDDSRAKAFAGDTKSDSYYQKLWELSGAYTKNLFKNASYKLACLIYTAWVNAGSPPFPGTTGVAQISNNNPSFILKQNYPNPFNPSTIISYQLSSAGHVTLMVYDLLGKEVATLVDGYYNSGIYHFQFFISNLELPSGVYFYRLSWRDFAITRKMLLIK